MRIALIIAGFSPGGAERVMAIMANYWAKAAHEVIIFTISGSEEEIFYELDDRVKIYHLGLSSVSKNKFAGLVANLRRVLSLRKELATLKPDVSLSFIDKTNIIHLVATFGLPFPRLVSERIDPKMHSIGHLWSTLRKLSYLSASAIIVQTKAAAKYFFRSRNCVVIPNPLLTPRDYEANQETAVKRKLIVGLGRLYHQKGFDLLIRAFALIAEKHQDFNLEIWGEGPERENLENLITSLSVEQRVTLPGLTKHPFLKLQQGLIFVLPSRYEGFPNALCEAMTAGLACIAFDCPSGPRDIIKNNVNGILVQNGEIGALANAISYLIENEPIRERLGNEALRIQDTLSVDKIMQQWTRLAEGKDF